MSGECFLVLFFFFQTKESQLHAQSTGFLSTSRSFSSRDPEGGECMYFQPAVSGSDIRILQGHLCQPTSLSEGGGGGIRFYAGSGSV